MPRRNPGKEWTPPAKVAFCSEKGTSASQGFSCRSLISSSPIAILCVVSSYHHPEYDGGTLVKNEHSHHICFLVVTRAADLARLYGKITSLATLVHYGIVFFIFLQNCFTALYFWTPRQSRPRNLFRYDCSPCDSLFYIFFVSVGATGAGSKNN